MKNILLTFAICLLSFVTYAQEEITTELENAYQEHRYDAIIYQHSEKANEYPAKAVYYVGMAYYMKADDVNTIKLMDLSIQKDPTDPDAHFIKGMTLNYMGQFNAAIVSFNKAIELDFSNPNYFSGLGDSYISLNRYKEALSAYIAASEKDEPIERPFVMIPQLYAELNQPEKALKAFYSAKEKIAKDSDLYISVLYNIGIYEFLNKDYDEAEVALKELLSRAPNDFQSRSKLIQVYYGKKEYEKAAPYRNELYQAYEQGVLEGNLAEMFCFDQFEWQDKLVFGFERFAGNEDQLYYKHIFYVTDQNTGETEFTIQTENSPISIELGGPKYVLGMDQNGTHSTFGYGFNADFDYADLKNTVVSILDGKVQAATSSRKGKR